MKTSFSPEKFEYKKLNYFEESIEHSIYLNEKNSYISQGILVCFCPPIIFASCYKKLVFLLQLPIIDTRQARKNLVTRFKKLATRLKHAVKIFSAVEILPNF